MCCYGGLCVVLLVMFVIFGLVYLVIIGVLLCVGFFFKDVIIEVVLGVGGIWGLLLGGVVLLGVGVIVFYMM